MITHRPTAMSFAVVPQREQPDDAGECADDLPGEFFVAGQARNDNGRVRPGKDEEPERCDTENNRSHDLALGTSGPLDGREVAWGSLPHPLGSRYRPTGVIVNEPVSCEAREVQPKNTE